MAFSNRQEPGNLSVFVTGAMLGAGMALLFAPQAGWQLRSFLRDYARCAKEGLDEAANRGADILERRSIMLYWAGIFLVVGIIAGILGLAGVAGTATYIAYVLFVLFVVIAIIGFIIGRRPPAGV